MSAAGRRKAVIPHEGNFFSRAWTNILIANKRLLRHPHRPSSRERGAQVRRRWLIAGLAVAAAVLAGMFYFDAPLTKRVADLPGWLAKFFQYVTRLGLSGVYLWPLAILMLVCAFLGARNLSAMQQRALAAGAVRLQFLFLAIAVPGLFVTIVKRLIGRMRPTAPDFEVLQFVPLTLKNMYASMPSGHAATGFSVLVAFGALWPRAVPALWVLAVLIAASRVVTYSHHLSDTLAGALAGMIGALIVREYFTARGLIFATDASGTLRAGAGPSFARIKQVIRSAIRG